MNELRLPDLVLTEKDIPDIDFLNTVRSSDRDYTSQLEREQAELNKKIFHNDYWRYNKEKIEYRYNKQHFRCANDFESIDWSNTVAVVGCSHVFGQGVSEQYTISGILSNEFGIPAVNLGIPGASNRQIHANAISVRKYFNPKKIIVVWTYPNRNTWIYDYNNNWIYKNSMPGLLSSKEKNKIINDYGLPAKHLEPQCEDTLFDWKLSRYIHQVLGHTQYSVNDKFLHPGKEFIGKWLKVEDLKPYTDIFNLSDEGTAVPIELDNANFYQLINKYYARDLEFNPKLNCIYLRHWGEQIHRDFADLIVKEHF